MGFRKNESTFGIETTPPKTHVIRCVGTPTYVESKNERISSHEFAKTESIRGNGTFIKYH